jgi:hypothetical protein
MRIVRLRETDFLHCCRVEYLERIVIDRGDYGLLSR